MRIPTSLESSAFLKMDLNSILQTLPCLIYTGYLIWEATLASKVCTECKFCTQDDLLPLRRIGLESTDIRISIVQWEWFVRGRSGADRLETGRARGTVPIVVILEDRLIRAEVLFPLLEISQ